MRARLSLLLLLASVLWAQRCDLKISDYENDFDLTFENGTSCDYLTISIDFDEPVISSRGDWFILNGGDKINLEVVGSNPKSQFFSSIRFENFKSVTLRDLVFQTQTGPALDIIGSNATIENTEFKNNQHSAIRSSGLLLLSHCLFFNNYNAINSTSSVEINSSNLTRNCGVNGAIVAKSAKLFNNSFIENCSNLNGGAVYCSESINSKGNIYRGNTAVQGSALYAKTAKTEDDIFLKNSAGDFGTVYLNGALETVKVMNCTFESNTGGALFSKAPVEISVSKFTKNTSLKSGAALYVSNLSKNTISNSEFTYNSAKDQGGAVYSNTIEVYSSVFVGNSALGTGGALLSEVSSTLKDCFFSSNYVLSKNPSVEEGGGACKSFSAEVSNTTFYNNSAAFSGGKGGGIYCSYNCSLSHSRFESNVGGQGGGFYGKAATATVPDTVKNCSFQHNLVDADGGALASPVVHVTNSYFGYNVAIHGSAVSAILSSVTMDSIFIGNAAFFGSIYGTSIIVQRSQFLSNQARLGGGAIYGAVNITVEDSKFEGNSASSGGAIESPSDTDVTVQNSSFVSNRASLKGGAISLTFGSRNNSIVLVGLEMMSNFARSSGGSLSISGNFGQLILNNYKAKEDFSPGNGGSIYVNVVAPASKIVVSHSSFEGCSSSLGGSVFVSGTINTIAFQSTSFINNTATLSSGGALVLRMSANSVKLESTSFLSNVANYRGSAIVQHKKSKVDRWEMTEVTAVSNLARIGGGFALQGTINNLTVLRSSFENNEGAQGSCLELQGTISIATVRGSTFKNNSAQQFGSAILSSGRINLFVFDSNFVQNSADSNGGAFYLGNSTMTSIRNCSFNENAALNGGSLYVQITSPLTSPILQDCLFSSNHASNEGGAVKLTATSASGSLFAKDCDFDGNSAAIGGGLSVSSISSTKRRENGISIENLNFSNNTATEGGGLESTGDVSVFSSRFDSNYATKGSGISMKNGTMNVYDLSMEDSQIFLSNSQLVQDSSSSLMEYPVTCSQNQHVQNQNQTYICVDNAATSSGPSIVYKNSNNVPIIVGIVVGVGGFLIILVIIASIVVYQKKQRAKIQANSFSHIDFSKIKLGEAKKSVIDFETIKIHREIGMGAFGIVFKGEWRGMSVAVKQIKSEQVTQVQMNDFVHEVTILKGLRSHPNVVLFLGVTFPPQPLSLVTEFCEGGGLYEYLRSSPVDFGKKLDFIKGIARGMLHLHEEGVIHRDLAVRNILLSKHLEPKVSDFGLSREHADSESAATTNSTIGPLKWMSPEAILQLQYSVKSDVFSFGVVIWEILEVKDPWPQMNAVDAALRVSKEGARMDIPDCATEALKEIMIGCWHEDPVERLDFEQIVSILEPSISLESSFMDSKHKNFEDSSSVYDSPEMRRKIVKK